LVDRAVVNQLRGTSNFMTMEVGAARRPSPRSLKDESSEKKSRHLGHFWPARQQLVREFFPRAIFWKMKATYNGTEMQYSLSIQAFSIVLDGLVTEISPCGSSQAQ